MCAQSLGLKSEDFLPYQPERARSNAFSRPRLEFKQRAMAWARAVLQRLEQLGIATQLDASDEFPSVWNNHVVDKQWVFFSRGAADREDIDSLLDQARPLAERVQNPSPHERHAFLAFLLDAEHVEVSAQVHPKAWVDFETFEARLSSPGAEQLLQQIQALPEQFTFGVVGVSSAPCTQATLEALQASIAQARDQQKAFWVGWSIPKDVAVDNASLLDEQLQDALVALAPIYQQMSWRREDDAAGMNERIETMRKAREEAEKQRAEEEKKRREQRAEAKRQQQDISRQRTLERVQYAPPRKNISLSNLFRSDTPAGSRNPASPSKPPAPSPSPPQGRSASSATGRSDAHGPPPQGSRTS